MRVARLAAAGVVAGLALGTGTTAASAGVVTPSAANPTGTFTNPPSDEAAISGPGGPVTLTGEVDRPGGFVKSVDITISWDDKVAGRPKIPHPDIKSSQYQTAAPSSSFVWSYPLTNVANGHYTIYVTGHTTDATGGTPQDVTVARPFTMDLAPVAPAGLVDTLDKAKRTVTLNWTANPEPDLIGYYVFRAGPTSKDKYALIAGVVAPATTYTDTSAASAPVGTYRYELIAGRPKGAGGTTLAYSPVSTESDAALASPPMAATTTSAAPSGTKTTTVPQPSAAALAGGLGSNPVLPGGNGLSDYQALLNQVQSSTAVTQPPDSGYADKLPYQPQKQIQAITLPNDAGPLGSGGGSGNQRTIEYVAGALLLAVVAGFALLLKRAADQQPALEAVAAEAAHDTMIAEPVISEPEPEPAPLQPLRSVKVVPASAPSTPRHRRTKRAAPSASSPLATLFTPVEAPEPEPDLEPDPDVFDYEAERVFALAGPLPSREAERPLRSVWRD